MNRLGLVTIVVPDYDEAIEFFVHTLGFDLLEDLPQPRKRWVVVRPPGASETGVLLARATTDDQRAAIGNQTGGRVGFFLYTDDFEREHTRMQAAGVTFREPPRHESYGTVAVFEDRWGNAWDLIQQKEPS